MLRESAMTKNTKTLLLVLGGAAVLGAGGAAVYFATKKPEKVEGQGSTPNPNLPDTTKSKPGITISTTTEQLAQIANAAATMNLATALKLATSGPVDMGSAGGASL
jgi:hypothetical protein